MCEILALFKNSDELYQFSEYSKRYGHAVIAGKTVEKCRHILRERKPSAVVAPIDYQCGEVLELVRWAKSESELKGIHFLLYGQLDELSKFGSAQMLGKAARALGADKFIVMPHFAAAELWWQIAVILPD